MPRTISKPTGCGRARRGPIYIADVEADAVGPLEGVVLKDEVMAAVGGDQAALRNRKPVARVHKRDAFHADVGLVALGRREHLLGGRDLDDVLGGVVVIGQAYVQRKSVGLNPDLAGFGLELLEERRPMNVAEEVQRARRRAGEFVGVFDGLQRMAVDEHQAAAAEVGGHVVFGIAEPVAIADHVVDFEWVVAVGKEIGRELEFPCLDWLMRSQVDAEVPAFAGMPVFDDGRTLDHYFGAGRGLVADHGVRSTTAARRTDHFAIDTFCNDDALARLEHLRRMIDGAEWMFLCAGTVVVRVFQLVVDVISFGEMLQLLPNLELGTVGHPGVVGVSCGG